MTGSCPEILSGNYAPPQSARPRNVSVTDWNIDRGEHFNSVRDFLRRTNADLLILQEADLHTRRTQFRDVAGELARSLQLNFVWGCEFQELLQGPKESPAYTGQATLSRWPIRNARVLRFRRQSHFWRPHWFVPHVHPFQVRLGERIALVCEVDFGGRKLAVYNLHLESRNTDRLRMDQLIEVLKDSARYDARTPVLLAGDFNLNANHPELAAEIQRAGFRPVLNKLHPTAHFHFLAYVAIDWIYIRGPIQGSGERVDSSVRASDHFPISFQLAL